MRAPRLLTWCLTVASLLIGGTLYVGTAAQAAQTHAVVAERVSTWAPAAGATIHPGTQMVTGGEQCTADFVFTDAVGHVYLGYAAHCSGTGTQSQTDGCTTGSVALGTLVRLGNGAGPTSSGSTAGHGHLAYSSWISMHRLGTKDAGACAYNDFALVRVDHAYLGRVNPSVPFWGGPVAMAASRPAAGDSVYSWGQSSLRPTTVLSPKAGLSLGSDNAWSTRALTLSPGIPGDSGSGFLDGSGRAFGVLSTIAVTPVPGANGVGSLARELAFAQAHSGIKGLRLAAGTEPFTG